LNYLRWWAELIGVKPLLEKMEKEAEAI